MVFPETFSIRKNFSLRDFNTFGVEVFAENYMEIHSEKELEAFFRWRKTHLPDLPYLIIGGGSNMLLCSDIPGMTIKLNLKGKKLFDSSKSSSHAVLEAAASENWHETVMYALENGLGGMENLALIPGDCGTSPVQNIGAYGVELKDIFLSCKAFDTEHLTWKEFTIEECQFAYRDSFFKRNKNWIISSVCFSLTKQNHALVTSYGSILDYLPQDQEISPKTIAEAVIKIRTEKLPNPKITGNAGSFFKNPIVENQLAESLLTEFPEMPTYPVQNGVKIPAGWLIENTGWKGKVLGHAGVHPKQALVLVNADGEASGKDIYQLSEQIIRDVKEKFNISLEREVNCLYCG